MKKLAILLAALMLLSLLPMTAFAAEGTYCVAGSDVLCGESWNPAGNPMALNADGLYEKVFNNIPGGIYEFKVTDGTWDNSWGNNGANYSINLSKESHVTILFNADTKEISVEIEPVEGAEEVELSYTVAGQAGLCGADWDPSQNPMTKNADGLHEITFEAIPAGTYEFKVTTGSWAASWGNGNNNYSITLEAASDVTITFDPETSTIETTITPVGGDAPVEPPVDVEPAEPTYYVAGVAALCGEEWACAAEANKMALNADGLYEILYKNVKAGNYEFKVTDGTWNNSWGTEGQNYQLNVPQDGEVKILFNAETGAITVQVPSAPTGDTSFVYGFAVLMAVSAAALVLLTKKKTI